MGRRLPIVVQECVVHTRTAASDVVASLRGRILSGALQPGMTLPPERTLASELAVSRSTLREGLSILAHMGLITIQPGRSGGAVVTRPPAATVSASIALLWQTRAITAGQLCEFRRALEVEAAQLAAGRASADDLHEITSALRAYAAPGLSSAQQNVHGRAFHQAVARASGNPLLAATMGSLNDAFAACFALLHDQPDPVELIIHLHQPIHDAIAAGNQLAAREAMLAHFDQLAAVLRELGLNDRPLAASEGDPPSLPHDRAADPTRNSPSVVLAPTRPSRSRVSGKEDGKGVLPTPRP